ncbi:neurexin-3-like [Menidia menidia]
MFSRAFYWCVVELTANVLELFTAREENMATFRGSEYFCYDLSQNPIQSSSDEITLSFKTWQRNGLILHTGKSADYVNLALKDGAVSLVINLGSGAFEAIVEPVNGKFNDNSWHDVKVTRNLRQVRKEGRGLPGSAEASAAPRRSSRGQRIPDISPAPPGAVCELTANGAKTDTCTET